MICPECNGENVRVDYRVAFKRDDGHWYHATCECGARLEASADPRDVAKMIPLRGVGAENKETNR